MPIDPAHSCDSDPDMAAIAPDALPRPPRSDAWALAGFALLSTAAALASLHLTRFGGGVAALWVANGLLVGSLVLLPRARWFAWAATAVAGQAAARLVLGDDLLLAVGLGAANLIESLIVAGWLRRGVEDLRQAASLGRLSREAAASTVFACGLSATLATLVVGARVQDPVWVTWTVWFMAHGLGIVVVGTLVSCLAHPSVRLSGRPGHRLDYAACLGLMVLGCGATFLQSRYPLLFLAYLPLVLLAYRHGLSGMVSGTLLLAASSGVAAATDSGPFALMQAPPLARVLLWQAYVASGCVLAYATSVAVTERIRLLRRVRRNELQLQALADNLPAMVAHFDKDVRYTYANARSRAMMGNVELVGRTLPEVRGDAYPRVRPYVDGVLRGERQNYEITIPMAQGDVDLHVQFVPDCNADGKVQGFYSLGFDITEQNRIKRELERLARDDALTGMANRRFFEERLAAAVNRTSRTGAPLMLLSFDLDRFKGINDNFGHAVGDEVLRRFAEVLRSSVFDVDIVARLGGDEFVALVEYSAGADVGEQIARRVIAALQAPMEIGGRSLKISTSIGIGLHRPVRSAERLMGLADEALYEAKALGRDTWALREG
jgi:diguanylate cyclase (GGDEF)-like protein